MENGNSPVPGITLRIALSGHDGPINLMSWSPDGRYLASPSDDKTIRFWDSERWDCIKKLNVKQEVGCVEWSQHGDKLASISKPNDNPGNSAIHIWDIKNQIKLYKELFKNGNHAHEVAWLPNINNKLAFCTNSGFAYLLNLDADYIVSKPIHRPAERPESINCLAWSSDGSRLAIGSDDCKAYIYFISPGQKGIPRVELIGPESPLYCLAWKPETFQLAAGGQNGKIYIWDLQADKPIQVKHVLKSNNGSITELSFSNDGMMLVSTSNIDFCLWRTDTWEKIAAIDDMKLNNAWPMANWPSSVFHPTQPILATPGEDNSVIRIWDIDYRLLLSNNYVNDSNSNQLLPKHSNTDNSILGKTGQSSHLKHGKHHEQDSKRIFISCSHEDEDFVLKFSSNLKNRGVPIWVYLWDNTIPGTDTDQAIDNAIKNCTHFLIILSPASVSSEEVKSELWLAHKLGKKFVPVICKHCDIPRRLGPIIYADFTFCGPNDEDQLKKVLHAFDPKPQPLQ